MPMKNPALLDRVVLRNGGVIEREDGTDIIAINSAGTVTTITGSTTPSDIPLTQNHILVGNASGLGADVAMSGDATIASSGAITIGSEKINLTKLSYEQVTVSISSATSGTGTFTTGSKLFGWYVSAITGSATVKSVVPSGTTVTVTLSGSDTATIVCSFIKA